MDYEGFKSEIFRMTGINLSLYKEKQMKRRIDSLVKKNGYDCYDKYIRAINIDRELFDEFINYLTINVSEFYRNPEQWLILEKEIFPRLLQKKKNLKIWSSACSTGDEPYTLVMILSKFLPLKDIRILATDIDRNALEKAREGIYSGKSLENLPSDFLNRYFTEHSGLYRIKDEIKACVEFKQMNLLSDPFPQKCDLIVCRNVLIYFTEEAKADIYKKFSQSLCDEGILFVGSTEQIILSNRYALKPIRTFFYIKDNLLQSD